MMTITQQRDLNEGKIMKKNPNEILKLKSTIIEMKKSLDGFTRFKLGEGKNLKREEEDQ